MNSVFFHSPLWHGIQVALAGALLTIITIIIDAIHSGAIKVSPAYAVLLPVGAALLSAAAVAVRNWIEANKATVAIEPALPVRPAQAPPPAP